MAKSQIELEMEAEMAADNMPKLDPVKVAADYQRQVEAEMKKELDADAEYSQEPAGGKAPDGRFITKNYGVESNANGIKKYLEKRNPAMDFAVSDSEMYYKPKGGKNTYHPVDVNNSILNPIQSYNRYQQDPAELVRDTTDIFTDVGKGVIDNVGGYFAGGGVAPLLARTTIGGITENARQAIGQDLGIEGNFSPIETAASGLMNGFTPLAAPAYRGVKSGLVSGLERLGGFDNGAIRHIESTLPVVRSGSYVKRMGKTSETYDRVLPKGFNAMGSRMMKNVNDEIPTSDLTSYAKKMMANSNIGSYQHDGYKKALVNMPIELSRYNTVNENTGRWISRPLPPIPQKPIVEKIPAGKAFEYPTGEFKDELVGELGTGYYKKVPVMARMEATPARTLAKELPPINNYETYPEVIEKRVLKSKTGINGVPYGPNTPDEPFLSKGDMLTYKNALYNMANERDLAYEARKPLTDMSKRARQTLLDNMKGQSEAEKLRQVLGYEDNAFAFHNFKTGIDDMSISKGLEKGPERLSRMFEKMANPKNDIEEAWHDEFKKNIAALAREGDEVIDPTFDQRVHTASKYFQSPKIYRKTTPIERVGQTMAGSAAYMGTDHNRLGAAAVGYIARPAARAAISAPAVLGYTDYLLPRQRFVERQATKAGDFLNIGNKSPYRPAMGSTLFNLYRDPLHGAETEE